MRNELYKETSYQEVRTVAGGLFTSQNRNVDPVSSYVDEKTKKVIHKEIKECQLHYQERSKEIQVLIFYLEARIFQDDNETQLLRMKFKNKCDLLPYSEKDGCREELKSLKTRILEITSFISTSIPQIQVIKDKLEQMDKKIFSKSYVLPSVTKEYVQQIFQRLVGLDVKMNKAIEVVGPYSIQDETKKSRISGFKKDLGSLLKSEFLNKDDESKKKELLSLTVKHVTKLKEDLQRATPSDEEFDKVKKEIEDVMNNIKVEKFLEKVNKSDEGYRDSKQDALELLFQNINQAYEECKKINESLGALKEEVETSFEERALEKIRCIEKYCQLQAEKAMASISVFSSSEDTGDKFKEIEANKLKAIAEIQKESFYTYPLLKTFFCAGCEDYSNKIQIKITEDGFKYELK